MSAEVQMRMTADDEQQHVTELVIIDDDPAFSTMLKDYLYSSGKMLAELFSSGEQFIKTYSPQDNRTIILDYHFGKESNLTGIDILKRIRAINMSANVIVVSSQDSLEIAVENMRRGACDYFIKNTQTVFVNILSSLQKIRTMLQHKMN